MTHNAGDFEHIVVSYVEIDVPHCSLTYSIAPCTASLVSSPPTGTIKCFNSLGTCQDRDNFTDAPVTLRFIQDTGFGSAIEANPAIDAFPFIKSIDHQPSIVSLGGELGQRATVKVVFRDAPHSDAGPDFDKYPADRNYADPYSRGTFWGKFRARNPYLRGRPLRLIRGVADQTLAEMETRHFVIESIDGPGVDGEFAIIAKDILQFTTGDRSVAPVLSNGFLNADITDVATTLTLSPSGIGSEYPTSGYAAIGGKEIVSFTHQGGNDANTILLVHADGDDATQPSDMDDSASNRTVTWGGSSTQIGIDTAQSVFGGASLYSNGASPEGEIDFPDSTDWAFSGVDFTIDFRARVTSLASQLAFFGQEQDANNYYKLVATTTGVLTFTVRSGGVDIVTMSSAAGAIAINTWYHLVVQRTGTTWNIGKDGASVASVVDADVIPNFAGVFMIHANGAAGETWDGWIDEFRVSNVARYTFPYTVPAGAYSGADVLAITRAQLNTAADAHSAQDRAQLIVRYAAQDPANIISDLLQTYAAVPSAYIPLADWQSETAGFLGTVYTLNITEPTGVDKLISELITQMGAAIWWDDLDQLIHLQILRAISTTAERFNEDNVLTDTLEIREQPEKRISQVIVYFGQINPLLKVDETSNYRSTQTEIDAQSEADEGSAAIKKIYARGIAQGGRTVATRAAQKHLSRYVRPPRRFNFEMLRYSTDAPHLGIGIRLGGGEPSISSWPFQDETGERVDVPLQITRHNPMADRHIVEAEEMLFTQFGSQAIDTTNKTIILDANENDINLRTRHDELFPAPSLGDTITCIIAEGTIIGSTSTATSALVIGTWPAGSPAITINVIVRGRIEGHGGQGGQGRGSGANGPGLVGGNAFYTRKAISLVLNQASGEIWGGGGGGGGATGAPGVGAGGGGGAGQLPGVGGGGDQGGDTGTTEAGGVGGTALAGEGGGPGLAGETASGPNPGSGGAAGGAIDGVSYCTKTGTGDIRGSETN